MDFFDKRILRVLRAGAWCEFKGFLKDCLIYCECVADCASIIRSRERAQRKSVR